MSDAKIVYVVEEGTYSDRSTLAVATSLDSAKNIIKTRIEQHIAAAETGETIYPPPDPYEDDFREIGAQHTSPAARYWRYNSTDETFTIYEFAVDTQPPPDEYW